jgi:hypothetical protein
MQLLQKLWNDCKCCLMLGLLLCLAACGKTVIRTTASEPRGATTTMSNPTPAATQNTPAPDEVTIFLDKTQYGLADTLKVTISSRVATPITTSDHQSACTIVKVQMQRADSWVEVGKCLQGTPTRRITLDANSTTTVVIGPAATNLATNAHWHAGTYRIVFTYILGKDEITGPSTTIYSAPFTIGSLR